MFSNNEFFDDECAENGKSFYCQFEMEMPTKHCYHFRYWNFVGNFASIIL